MSNSSNPPDSLRTQAEVQLARAPGTSTQLTAEELLHELQVHQIELEVQNENLRLSLIELEKSRDRYVDFYDFSPVGYLTLNSAALISEANLTAATLLGVERGKLPQQRFATFTTAEDRDRWHRHFQQVLKQNEPQACELALLRSDGSRFFARLECLRMCGTDGINSVRMVLTDISERKFVEDELRTQEEFFHMIAENVQDFIAVLDLEGRRLYNNSPYARLFGDTEAMKGTDSFADIHPEDRERIRQAFAETVQSGIGLKAEFRFVLPNGDIRHMESHGGLIRNNDGQPLRVVVVSRDITDRVEHEKVISKLAFYDSLTHLPNRLLLEDRLKKAIADSKRSGRFGAVMFIDLDNFKPLNDTYGHQAGDMLLKEVAQRLAHCVREVDTVARFGGDEFVVVLGGLDANNTESMAQVHAIAEKIRTVLAEVYFINDTSNEAAVIKHRCTSSIGVVVFHNCEISVNDLLRRADMAMYEAKDSGRNRVCLTRTEDRG